MTNDELLARAYTQWEITHQRLAARPPCTNICCQPHTTNNHMPLCAYEVAEFNRPINWFAVLVGAALAAFVVFGLGW